MKRIYLILVFLTIHHISLEVGMFHKFTVVTIIFLNMFASEALAGELKACDLVTKEVVEKSSGLNITNVTSKDRGVFTSCTYETDNWQVNVGLIYYPGDKAGGDSATLALELHKEFERDNAPYKKPEPLANLGNAAAYYQSIEGDYHAIVVLSSGGNASGRLVVNAPTHDAVLAVAKAVLAGM